MIFLSAQLCIVSNYRCDVGFMYKVAARATQQSEETGMRHVEKFTVALVLSM